MLTGGCLEVYLLVQQQVLWGLPTGGIGSLRLWPRLSSVGPSKFGGPRLDFEIFFEFWIVCVGRPEKMRWPSISIDVCYSKCAMSFGIHNHLSRLMFASQIRQWIWDVDCKSS